MRYTSLGVFDRKCSPETIKAKTMSEMIIFQYEYLFFQSNMFSLKNKKNYISLIKQESYQSTT